MFNVSATGAGSAATPAGRVVFKVTGEFDPADRPRRRPVKALQTRTTNAMTDEIIGEYIDQLQRQLGVVVNDNALQTAEGS